MRNLPAPLAAVNLNYGLKTAEPKEVAAFVPPAPNGSKLSAIQLNDVYVDDRRIVYTVDRFTGGLYVLEMNI